MGLFIPGFIIPPGSSALTRSFLSAGQNSANQSSYTFSTLNIGATGADRYIVVSTMWANDAINTREITSLTVDGVELSHIATNTAIDTGGSESQFMRVELWGGFVDTANTSVSIVVTLNATVRRLIQFRYAIRGSTTTDWDAGRLIEENGSSGDLTFDNFTLNTGEVALFTQVHSPATSTMTWTGATEDSETTSESLLRGTVASNITPGTVSASCSSSGRDIAGIGVVFTP